MLKYVDSIYEYEKQLQERLQNEYDRVCSNLIDAKVKNITEYRRECAWRKCEIEEISRVLNISLLKKRNFEDIERIVAKIKNGE